MLVLLCGACTLASAQTITIDDAYQWAKENYPIYQQKKLIQERTKRNLNNIDKAYLPDINIQGQATYQSAVSSIPVEIPGFEIEELDKDQYKILAQINQLIYDGGELNGQRDKLELAELIELQKVEIDLYQLRQRISDVFFGILITHEQLEIKKYCDE